MRNPFKKNNISKTPTGIKNVYVNNYQSSQNMQDPQKEIASSDSSSQERVELLSDEASAKSQPNNQTQQGKSSAKQIFKKIVRFASEELSPEPQSTDQINQEKLAQNEIYDEKHLNKPKRTFLSKINRFKKNRKKTNTVDQSVISYSSIHQSDSQTQQVQPSSAPSPQERVELLSDEAIVAIEQTQQKTSLINGSEDQSIEESPSNNHEKNINFLTENSEVDNSYISALQRFINFLRRILGIVKKSDMLKTIDDINASLIEAKDEYAKYLKKDYLKLNLNFHELDLNFDAENQYIDYTKKLFLKLHNPQDISNARDMQHTDLYFSGKMKLLTDLYDSSKLFIKLNKDYTQYNEQFNQHQSQYNKSYEFSEKLFLEDAEKALESSEKSSWSPEKDSKNFDTLLESAEKALESSEKSSWSPEKLLQEKVQIVNPNNYDDKSTDSVPKILQQAHINNTVLRNLDDKTKDLRKKLSDIKSQMETMKSNWPTLDDAKQYKKQYEFVTHHHKTIQTKIQNFDTDIIIDKLTKFAGALTKFANDIKKKTLFTTSRQIRQNKKHVINEISKQKKIINKKIAEIQYYCAKEMIEKTSQEYMKYFNKNNQRVNTIIEDIQDITKLGYSIKSLLAFVSNINQQKNVKFKKFNKLMQPSLQYMQKSLFNVRYILRALTVYNTSTDESPKCKHYEIFNLNLIDLNQKLNGAITIAHLDQSIPEKDKEKIKKLLKKLINYIDLAEQHYNLVRGNYSAIQINKLIHPKQIGELDNQIANTFIQIEDITSRLNPKSQSVTKMIDFIKKEIGCFTTSIEQKLNLSEEDSVTNTMYYTHKTLYEGYKKYFLSMHDDVENSKIDVENSKIDVENSKIDTLKIQYQELEVLFNKCNALKENKNEHIINYDKSENIISTEDQQWLIAGNDLTHENETLKKIYNQVNTVHHDDDKKDIDIYDYLDRLHITKDILQSFIQSNAKNEHRFISYDQKEKIQSILTQATKILDAYDLNQNSNPSLATNGAFTNKEISKPLLKEGIQHLRRCLEYIKVFCAIDYKYLGTLYKSYKEVNPDDPLDKLTPKQIGMLDFEINNALRKINISIGFSENEYKLNNILNNIHNVYTLLTRKIVIEEESQEVFLNKDAQKINDIKDDGLKVRRDSGLEQNIKDAYIEDDDLYPPIADIKIYLSSEETDKVHIASEETDKVHIASEETDKVHVESEETDKVHVESEETDKVHIASEGTDKVHVESEETDKVHIASEGTDKDLNLNSEVYKIHDLANKDTARSTLQDVSHVSHDTSKKR